MKWGAGRQAARRDWASRVTNWLVKWCVGLQSKVDGVEAGLQVLRLMRRLQRRHSPRAFTPHKRRIDLPTSAGDCQVTQIATRSYASQVSTFTNPPALSNTNYDAQLRFKNAYIYLPTSANVRQATPVTTRSYASHTPSFASHQRRRLPSYAICEAHSRQTRATIYRPTSAKQRQLRRAVTPHKRVHLPPRQRRRPPSK